MEEGRKLEVAMQFRQLGELNFQNQNLSDACFYYINCLKVQPEWKYELKNRFLLILSCLGQMLERNQEFSEIFTLYEEALKLYDDSEVLHHNLGAHLLRLGYPDKAAFYFKEALKYNENYFPAYRSLHSTHCALVERWHYRMLNDTYRNRCYREAIIRKILQGFDTVLDIGTGTGLFCLYAAEGGAKSIYGCDDNPIMTSIAKKVLTDNFLADRIMILNKHSNDLRIPEDIPERVSLVVTETMDSCMLGERMLQTLIYAWENLLYPPSNPSSAEYSMKNNRWGAVIPYSGSLWFAAVQSRLLSKRYISPLIDIDTEDCASALASITLKDSVPENFQHLNLRNIELFVNLNEPYDTERLQLLPDCTFLTEARELFYVNFNMPELLERFLLDDTQCRFEVTCTKEGYFHALTAWFRVHLDEENVLCSAVDDANAKNCCWDQAIFPNEQAFHVFAGSKISVLANWTKGKVSLSVQQIVHPDGSVSKSAAPMRVSSKVVSMLNDISLLKNLKSAAVEFIQRLHGDEPNLRIMDLFPVPIFGLTVLRNVHLLNSTLNEFQLICTVSSQDDADIIMKIAENNQIPSSCLLFILEDIFDEHLTRVTSDNYFDVIMMNPLDVEGDLNEETINRIFTFKSLLSDNGLLLPRKIDVCGQLVYSDYVEENMRIVNDDINRCGIGPAINEFQVPQMVEMDVSSFKFEQYSSTFVCHQFELKNLKSEFSKEFFVNVVRQGAINCVLYWYNIHFSNNDNTNYCSNDKFSYVHQASFLCKCPISFHENERAVVQFIYHYGTFIINLKNCDNCSL